jgi:hypothetical protein
MFRLGGRRVKNKPVSVSSTNSEAEGSGEVDPEAFSEFSGDGSNGHLVSEGKEDDGGGSVRMECSARCCVEVGPGGFVRFSHQRQIRAHRTCLIGNCPSVRVT